MALETFKEIVERKGYLVDREDRKIFEKEIKKSNFGMGYSDMIEFILYDSNDNQLPQGDDAKLVRYIHINDKNINEYFLITKSEETKKLNDSSEFIIDLEKLIKEAGYSNGIFKTQVTLLNRRVGSEESTEDKLWIHEISPTRTEIRVVPLKNTTRPNQDLHKRYDLFVEGGNFRDDTIYYVRNFIEGIDIRKIVDNFIRSKGRIRDGRRYQRLIQKEFKVGSFDKLLNDIKARYIESMNYFIAGADWDITSNTYGKPKQKVDVVELTVSFIKSVAESALRNSIEYYLPKRRIQNSVELTRDEQVTFDRVKRILKTIKANQKFPSTVPGEVGGVVRGCTDKEALNYNPRAKENDGSCRYKEEELTADVVPGCTDKKAVNFNKYANKDDGSCKYQEKVDDFADLGGGTTTEVEDIKPPIEYTLKTRIFYIWSTTGSIKYKDKSGTAVETRGVEYDAHKITYRDGSIKFSGDVRQVPKIKKSPPKLVEYKIVNNSRKTRHRQPMKPLLRNEFERFEEGRGRVGFRGRRPGLVDIDGPEYFTGTPLTFKYKNKLEQMKTSSTIEPGATMILCAIENSIVPVPGLTITAQGGCGGSYPQTISAPKPKKRCLDPKAKNYNQVGSCKYDPVVPPPPPPKPRCNDPKAINYQRVGACVYPIQPPAIDEPVVITTPNIPPIKFGNEPAVSSPVVDEILEALELPTALTIGGGGRPGGMKPNTRPFTDPFGPPPALGPMAGGRRGNLY